MAPKRNRSTAEPDRSAPMAHGYDDEMQRNIEIEKELEEEFFAEVEEQLAMCGQSSHSPGFAPQRDAGGAGGAGDRKSVV